MSVCTECQGLRTIQGAACPKCEGAAPLPERTPEPRVVSAEDRWDLSSVALLPASPTPAIDATTGGDSPASTPAVAAVRPSPSARAPTVRRPFRPAAPARPADALARVQQPVVERVAEARAITHDTLSFERSALGVVAFREPVSDLRPSTPDTMMFERTADGVVEYRPPFHANPARPPTPANDVGLRDTAPYRAIVAAAAPSPTATPAFVTLPPLVAPAPAVARSPDQAQRRAAPASGELRTIAITAVALVLAVAIGALAAGAAGATWAACGVLVHAIVVALGRLAVTR